MKRKRMFTAAAILAVMLMLILSACENSLLESIETDIAEATTSLKPGFDIQYNGVSIAAGETVDVQNAGRNETVTHSFSIRNMGEGDLSLLGSPKVALVDGGSGFFSFSSNQPPSPIRGGGSADFTIDFAPDLVGSDYSATVTIETDAAGAASFSFTIRTDAYESDDTAPTGAVSVDGGATYATSRSVNLDITGSDTGGSGLYQMQVANDSGFTAASWEAYATSKAWTLPDNEGGNTVYVRFRDGAGNESLTYSDTITLDTAAPSGYVQINGSQDDYADDNLVTLTIVGNDSVSGVEDIKVSNSSVLNGASWQSYTGTIPNYQTTANDGVKTVYLQIRDAAGNVSPIFSDSIIVDTRAPNPDYVTIQYGYDYHDSSTVHVAFRADDFGGGKLEYMLANDASFTDSTSWITYRLGAPYTEGDYPSWTLESGYGERTVYIKFRDAFDDGLGSNHESDYITDTIIIDDPYEGTSGNNSTSEARSIEPRGWDPGFPQDINFTGQERPGEARQYDSDYYAFTLDSNDFSRMVVTATETTAADGETNASDGSMTVRLILPNSGGSLSDGINAGGSGVADYNPSGLLPAGDYIIGVSGGGNSTGYVIDVDFREYQGM